MTKPRILVTGATGKTGSVLVTRLAPAHQQDLVDLSGKPKMIKDLLHRAAEFAIKPVQQRRLGWDNEIVASFSGRGEQGRQHLVSKKKESTYGSEPSRQYFISATAVHLADQLLASE